MAQPLGEDTGGHQTTVPAKAESGYASRLTACALSLVDALLQKWRVPRASQQSIYCATELTRRYLGAGTPAYYV